MNSLAQKPLTIATMTQLAAPAIGQLLLQQLVILVDLAMLGHYSTTALAAIRLTHAIHWCLYEIASAFAVGSMALVGQAIGAHNHQQAAAVTRVSLWLALGLGLGISALSLLGLEPLLILFPVDPTTVGATAQTYLSLVLAAMPLHLLAIVAAVILQATGDTRTPFLVGILANGVNLLVNYSLIFGRWGAPELGIRGAAIGTVLAMGVNAAILVGLLLQGTPQLNLRGWGGEGEALSSLGRISLPALSERIFRSAGYLGFTGILASLGDQAMAAHGAILGVEEIAYEVAEGYSIAAATIVAQALGARNYQRADRGVQIATLTAIFSLGAIGVLFCLIPKTLLSIVSNDPAVLAAAFPSIYLAGLAQPIMAASIVLEQVLRSAGRTQTAFYVSLLGWVIVRVSLTSLFVFGLGWGLPGIWLGSLGDWLARVVALGLIFRQSNWQRQWTVKE